MLYAIVSDIHANLRAWYAVLDDMEDFGPEAILCLGDVVGYGPMPGEVLESVCEYADEIVIGNHDAVVAGRYSSDSFNDNARRVIDWTRDQLGDDVIDFFADLPADLDGENFTIAHAELGDPERFDYIENAEMARESLTACDSDILFVGHTHHAGIFVWDMAMDNVMRYDPTDFAALRDMRYIVNVGSVGDPRTEDRRASYCLYDSELREVFFRNVAFDIDEYRLDVENSTLPMPPWCLTIDQDLDEYITVVVERPTIVVTREKRPRLRISKGAIHAAAADEDPETALALERLEQLADQERKRKREAMQHSLTESLKVSQLRHQQTVAKLKGLHAKKRLEAQARAEAERIEREREEREREERAKEKKLELAQAAAARAREDRDRAERKKQDQRDRARKAIERKKMAAEERRKREVEEKARADAAAEKRKLAEEQRQLEAARAALEEEKRRKQEAEETLRRAAETAALSEAELERRKILEEKQKLEEERRRLEEERLRLEEERRRIVSGAQAPEPQLPVARPAPAPADRSKTAKLVLPTAPRAPIPVAAPLPVAVPARTVSETAQLDEELTEEPQLPPGESVPQAVEVLKQIENEDVDPETAKQLRIQTIKEVAEAKEAERRRKIVEKKAAQEAARKAAREAIRRRQEAARRKREQDG